VSVLREACALAVTDKAMPSNPVDGVPRAKHQKEPPDPFSLAEAEAIIDAARRSCPSGVFNWIEWRFFTGVRPSEAAGIHWPNVDLASSYMAVSEAIVRGKAKNKTKTAVARQVALNSRALAALQRQRACTQVAGAHVWLDPRNGKPWMDEQAFRKVYWTPLLKRLGIRYRPPGQMRHTFATMMLMAGRTPAWCAKQLGHSVEMFLRTYSRWLEGQQDDREVDGFEQWLSSPKLPRRTK
jgi:integrase